MNVITGMIFSHEIADLLVLFALSDGWGVVSDDGSNSSCFFDDCGISDDFFGLEDRQINYYRLACGWVIADLGFDWLIVGISGFDVIDL